MLRYPKYLGIGALVLSILVGGCGQNNGSTTATPSSNSSNQAQASATSGATNASGEPPVAPEQSPTGDIPDTQAFVKYSSAQSGYQVDVPEGWARSMNGSDVLFVSKFDGVKVSVTSGNVLSATQLKNSNELDKLGRAVRVSSVTQMTNTKDQTIKVVYESNSDPDSVTGKQIRLDNNTYFFFKAGKIAKITLWAPHGADNVDQWNRISSSFTW